MRTDTSSSVPTPPDEHHFIPPLPSRATRGFKRYNRGSSRARLVGGVAPTEMRMESGLEKKACYVLLARPDVLEIQEQPEERHYRDPQGRPVGHTFDLLVTLRTGVKLFVAVKPERVAEKIGFRETLRHFAAQTPASVADGIILITDKDLTRDVVHDAALVHAVRLDPVTPEDATVRQFVSLLNGSVTVASIVAATGLASRAFRAVVRMIGDGTLEIVGPRRIGYATRVMPTARNSRRFA